MFKDTHHSGSLTVNGETLCFYAWRSTTSKTNSGASSTLTRSDPRTHRFGFSSTDADLLGLSMRSVALPWTGTTNKAELRWSRLQISLPDNVTGGFEYWRPPNVSTDHFAPYGLVSNNPDVAAVNASHPARYSDTDGTIRPGDGYFGSLPSLPANFKDRPLILNRPFRSVAELGYVSRDLPWKTLDFSTRFSGDLGLLDVFTLNEGEDAPYQFAGRINLNSAGKEVLTAAMDGTSKQVATAEAGLVATTISKAEAKEIAKRIVEERSASGPFTSRGDLISRVFNKSGATSPLTETNKVEREAAIRTLAELGTTRTWNFLIDIIAQTGRFIPTSSGGQDFLVDGESRRWVHVAIDRMTGEVVDTQTEIVNE